jgi:hypothetical protein
MRFSINARHIIVAMLTAAAVLLLVFGTHRWVSREHQAAEQTRVAQEQRPKSEKPQPADLDPTRLLILIRSALVALDHANKTGNYTVLRDLGAPEFKAENSSARLAEIFANLRTRNIDLSAVAVMEPQITKPPVIDGRRMRISGLFAGTVPLSFDLLWQRGDASSWALFGISVSLEQPPRTSGNSPDQPRASAETMAQVPQPPALRGTAR